jgi:hypothetical protein
MYIMFDRFRQNMREGWEAYRENQEAGQLIIDEWRAAAILELQAKAMSGAVLPVAYAEQPTEEFDALGPLAA